jgi:hypothetical protein
MAMGERQALASAMSGVTTTEVAAETASVGKGVRVARWCSGTSEAGFGSQLVLPLTVPRDPLEAEETAAQRQVRLQWAEGTVDNEHLNRKSSKCTWAGPRRAEQPPSTIGDGVCFSGPPSRLLHLPQAACVWGVLDRIVGRRIFRLRCGGLGRGWPRHCV